MYIILYIYLFIYLFFVGMYCFQVYITALSFKRKKKEKHDLCNNIECKQLQLIYPLKLVYLPKELFFEIDDVTIVHSLK